MKVICLKKKKKNEEKYSIASYQQNNATYIILDLGKSHPDPLLH